MDRIEGGRTFRFGKLELVVDPRTQVKLHRCPNEVVRIAAHPCHRVQKALGKAGVEFEVVKHPWAREKRDQLERLCGQTRLPVIEFPDGTTYREESKLMAARIKSGDLFDS